MPHHDAATRIWSDGEATHGQLLTLASLACGILHGGMSRRAVLRAILGIAALPPLVLGAAMVLSGPASAWFAGLLSSAVLDATPEHRLAVMATGIHVLVLGAWLASAAWSPDGQRTLVLAAALLFVLRGLQRLGHAGTLASAYGVDAVKNALHVAWLVGLGMALAAVAPPATPDPDGAERGRAGAGRSDQLCSLALTLVGLAHVAGGALLALWTDAGLAAGALVLGAERVRPTAQLAYIVKPLGVYMFVFGTLALRAAAAPRRHARVVAGLAITLVLDALLRWAASDLAREAFGIGAAALALQGAALAAAAAALLLPWLAPCGAEPRRGPDGFTPSA
jgi:hypothetical protein